ncbi:MAG: uroporphyrinogen-III synthase [Alphaproteobacteria bacterium]|nr:uroporphyrinogen-III synthase [Alphaproteobacteria bacterium]MBL7099444.1 uroporphyrinogen-III synthase [Alphaproteobacteria bacterium]
MRVLVTRPIDSANETAALLRERGHEPVVAPLLEVRYHDGHPLHLDGVQGLLATSANGLRAFARRTSRRDFPVFAVGSQTAHAARDAGFSDVHNADGNADTLAQTVQATAKPGDGPLLHATGAEAEGLLAAALIAAGFTVHTEVLYDVPAATDLPQAARDAFPTLDAVLIFSARSAQALVDCVTRAGLTPAAARIVAAAISPAAAKPLSVLNFREVRVAAHPNQASVLDALG